MLHSSLNNHKSSIRIRNKNNDNSPPSPNLSTSLTNIINSNQRFNEELSNIYYIKDNPTMNLIKKMKNMKQFNINKNQSKKNKNNYQSRSEFSLPMLSNANASKTIIPKNEFLIKKTIRFPPNKIKSHPLIINPISLNLDNSLYGKQKKLKLKDPFMQRVNNCKQSLKNEFFAYKNKNYSYANNSVSRTQIYNNNNEKKFKKKFNKSNYYYLDSLNKEVNNDLNILFKKIVIPKLYNHKSIFNI